MATCERTVVRGPSVDEWRRYKRKIIDLYRTRPLKEVKKEMEVKYNFYATKRMYDTRFRAWKIDKNMKGSEKDILAREITQSHKQGEPAKPVAINDKTLKKIMRHVHSQSRRESKSPRESSQQHVDFAHSLFNLNMLSGTNDVDKGVSYVTSSDVSNAVTPILLTPSSMVDSDDLGTEESSQPTASPDSVLMLTPSTGRSMPAELYNWFESPQISLELSPAARTKRLALHNIQTFYLSTLDRSDAPAFMSDFLATRSTSESKLFWHNIKHGIYLWKINSQFPDRYGRAFDSFNEANVLAASALSSEPLDFCRELLLTLSPINTSIYPPLRHQILSYLVENATRTLGSEHPITMLCSALLQDDDCLDVSMSGLDLMLNMFSKFLGASHQAVYRIMEALITMTRWSGNFETARQFAENALCLAQFDLGRDSYQARRSAVELANVLTKLGDHGRTLSLRLKAVQKPMLRSPYDLDFEYHHDGLAVYTMEDLAEYYIRFGNVQEGIAWLSRAKSIALEQWGVSIATSHVSDKLERLLAGSTRGQVLDV